MLRRLVLPLDTKTDFVPSTPDGDSNIDAVLDRLRDDQDALWDRIIKETNDRGARYVRHYLTHAWTENPTQPDNCPVLYGTLDIHLNLVIDL